MGSRAARLSVEGPLPAKAGLSYTKNNSCKFFREWAEASTRSEREVAFGKHAPEQRTEPLERASGTVIRPSRGVPVAAHLTRDERRSPPYSMAQSVHATVPRGRNHWSSTGQAVLAPSAGEPGRGGNPRVGPPPAPRASPPR
jgi:hypothetical protein